MAGGGGKTTRCTICHGADLMGMGPVPGLAGRSPSYLVRQLYDMRHGMRSGVWTSLMMPVVSQIDDRRHAGDSRLSSVARPAGVCLHTDKIAGCQRGTQRGLWVKRPLTKPI